MVVMARGRTAGVSARLVCAVGGAPLRARPRVCRNKLPGARQPGRCAAVCFCDGMRDDGRDSDPTAWDLWVLGRAAWAGMATGIRDAVRGIAMRQRRWLSAGAMWCGGTAENGKGERETGAWACAWAGSCGGWTAGGGAKARRGLVIGVVLGMGRRAWDGRRRGRGRRGEVRRGVVRGEHDRDAKLAGISMEYVKQIWAVVGARVRSRQVPSDHRLCALALLSLSSSHRAHGC